jgi:hypothetical protein
MIFLTMFILAIISLMCGYAIGLSRGYVIGVSKMSKYFTEYIANNPHKVIEEIKRDYIKE